MSSDKNQSSGMGLNVTFFLIFLILKLAGIGDVADWSWWWITSPLWIPIALILGLSIITVIIKVIISNVNKHK
jgi:hypothetical protein